MVGGVPMSSISDFRRNRTMTRHQLPQIGATLCLAASFLVFSGIGWSIEPPVHSDSAVTMTQGEYETMAMDFGKSYVSPLNLPASAFRSDGVNPDQLRTSTYFDDLRGMGTQNAIAVAPVYLPRGATVSMVGVQLYDGVGTTGPCGDDPLQRDVWAQLFRVNNYTGEVSTMASFSTTGSDPDYQYFVEMSVDYPLVDYPDYSYYAVTKVCHSAHAFCAMQIFYLVD